MNYDKNTLLIFAILFVIFIIILIYAFRSDKVTFATRHPMDFTSTAADWIDWDGYYTFDSNYFLSVNKYNRIIGDAINIGNDKYVLTVIPPASSRNVGDWVKLDAETSNDDDVYIYVFENSSTTTDFNQVYTYTEKNNDSRGILLEVIDDGGKRWVQFGGYTD